MKRMPGKGRMAVVAGAVVVLCALGLLGAGGVALSTPTDPDGAVDLGSAGFRSDGYAVASDSWDASTDLFGTLTEARITVTGPDGATPVFVGVAAPDKVDQYLRGVRYTNLHSKARSGPEETAHAGAAPAIRPEGAGIWVARASGTGTQTLRWPAGSGPVRLVVMNPDGSALVTGHGRLTATAPQLPWIGGGFLLGGAVVLAAGVVLIVVPVRRARRARRG